jgi:hypothetical protein
MSLHNIKLFIGLSILLAFISTGVFGLFQISHVIEAPMENCPYIQNNFSVCANNLNHIDDWRQFSTTTISSLIVFSFLVLSIILYFFGKQNFLKQKQYFYKWKYSLYSKKLYISPNKITRWLSLLENSPALQ